MADKKVKLHLGCGQVYLEGYINIDYPLDNHTVQQESVADEFADLAKLRYKRKTIDEVRLHHTYEHFPRHIAVALLASWHTWLKRGGVLHIEVPDFDETAKVALNHKSTDREKKIALRHIFGSNEAFWATHYEGWSVGRLTELIKLYGFKNIKVEQTSYLATRNVTIIAKKGMGEIDKKKAHQIARKYLKNFTLDESEFELSLLQIWLDEFDAQFAKTSAA